jgi:light-dependent protochlorophyllide reductase
MPDKTVIITGGNSGLGYECAKTIAAANEGWCIVIAGRSQQKITEAVEKLNATVPGSQVTGLSLDLASLKSVREFVNEFKSHDLPPLRALVCNAGIQVVSGTTYTEDGFETTFGVNHLGHFLLANLLLKNLVAPARIVVVSSDTHDPDQKTGMPAPQYVSAALLAFPEGKNNSPQPSDDPMIGQRRYTTSKLCNIYFTYELSRRLAKKEVSVTVNAFNPGLMPGTGLARDYTPIQRFIWNHVLPVVRPITKYFMSINSVHDSGQALARLVLDPELEKVTGKYFSGMKEEPSSKESFDTNKALELWESSVNLVKLSKEEILL